MDELKPVEKGDRGHQLKRNLAQDFGGGVGRASVVRDRRRT